MGVRYKYPIKDITAYCFVLIILFMLLTPQKLHSAGIKKLLVLDFINLEKNPNVQYLESSFTKSVKKKLKELFIFHETPEIQWQTIAKKNFLWREDWATKSAAMNLGLLAKQDVVISGGFVVTGTQNSTIITTVRILDISGKKIIADFKEKGPADARIFDTLDKIAKKIVEKSRAVLPTKDEWKQKGFRTSSNKPVIDNLLFGIQAGAGFMMLDNSNKFETKLPAFGLYLSGNLPFIWDKLALGLHINYIQESTKDGASAALIGLQVNTTNILLGGYLGLRFRIGNVFLTPRLGGGVVYQDIEVTGLRNETERNLMPFAAAAFDIGYPVGRFLNLVLTLESALEFDSGDKTLLNTGRLGVEFRL